MSESKKEKIQARDELKHHNAIDVKKRIEAEGIGIFLLKLFVAPIVLLGWFLFIYLFLDRDDFYLTASLTLIYFLPPLGKESVIPMGIAAGLHPVIIAMACAMMDISWALFLLYNYDFAKLIPLLGRWMDIFEKKNRKIQKGHIWIEGFYFFGVALFVMFPLQGSGGIGGTIVGRLLGLNRYVVFVAITLGAVIGTLLIAYAANTMKTIMMTNLPLGIALAFIVAVVVIYFVFIRRDTEV